MQPFEHIAKRKIFYFAILQHFILRVEQFDPLQPPGQAQIFGLEQTVPLTQATEQIAIQQSFISFINNMTLFTMCT